MERCQRESTVWSFFTKKADFIATCNTCSQNYSYRTGTSNLRKHWYNKHGKQLEGKPCNLSENTSDNSDEEQDKAVAAIVKNSKSLVTWKYFDPLDLDKCEATCKICSRTVSFKYMSDLKQHVQNHGHEPTDSDDEFVPEVHEKTLKRKYKSRLWEFFRATDDKMAQCLMCHNLFNYGSTITNLRRHLMRKHGESARRCQDDEPQSVIEYEGNLYEVVKEDDEDQPKDMDVVYLNEEHLEDSFDDLIKTPTPKRKFINIPTKRIPKITKEQVHSTRDTCSKEPELPSIPIPTSTPTNAMGSLDYFGQYVVSLLKELPKPVSDQLQSEIIKQILTNKMALETQTVVANYELSRSRENENDTNVAVPIRYTVVQSNETAEKLNEITENVVKDDACEELLKVTDVWSYFDTDSGKRAQCTVCHITLNNEYDELKAHLKDNHPKLLLQLLQNKDQDSDAASNDDNENTFTEIVYLEQEPTEDVKIHKEKPKSFAKPAKKRERLHSLYSSDDIPHKKLKKEEENDELGVFIKYITCLLKKLPADVFSNVQIEIINTILKANSQVANTSRSMLLSTELKNTSSNIITIDGTTPISNTMTGHNYTITVAPPKVTNTDNGN